jgi:hypothetical protein
VLPTWHVGVGLQNMFSRLLAEPTFTGWSCRMESHFPQVLVNHIGPKLVCEVSWQKFQPWNLIVLKWQKNKNYKSKNVMPDWNKNQDQLVPGVTILFVYVWCISSTGAAVDTLSFTLLTNLLIVETRLAPHPFSFTSSKIALSTSLQFDCILSYTDWMKMRFIVFW